MPPNSITRPAGVLTVPLGVVDVCQAGTSLHRAPVERRRCRRGSGRARPRRPPPPISFGSSTIATTGAPVRLAIATVSPRWSAWPCVSRIVVGVDLVGAAARLRVARQERVDEHRRCRRAQREGRVAQKAELHLTSPSGRFAISSVRASSKPTATPTSMPRRVSSATSVPIACRRPLGVLDAGRRGDLPSCVSPNQPPAASASSSTRCRLRRRAGDELLRLRAAARSPQRGQAASSSSSV